MNARQAGKRDDRALADSGERAEDREPVLDCSQTAQPPAGAAGSAAAGSAAASSARAGSVAAGSAAAGSAGTGSAGAGAVPAGAVSADAVSAGGEHHPSTCRAREVLQRVGDKWSVYVIDLLGHGTMRFSELHRSIDGITSRMLTVTLRGLERDGIVTRTIHPVIPPRVEYELTPMGRTLLDTIGQLVIWTDSHLCEIDAARAAYDAKHGDSC